MQTDYAIVEHVQNPDITWYIKRFNTTCSRIEPLTVYIVLLWKRCGNVSVYHMYGAISSQQTAGSDIQMIVNTYRIILSVRG